ncbi:V-type ATP synthase subunit I [Enterococcus sp. LJL99]
MAVNKMEKITLIATSKNEERMLQTIQGLQAVEIKELAVGNLTKKEVTDYLHTDAIQLNDNQKKNYEELLVNLQEAMLFIERFSGTKSKKNRLKRRVEHLETIEGSFDETKLTLQLKEIAAIKKELERIQTEKQQANKEETILSYWQSLDVIPSQEHFSSVDILLGSMTSENKQTFMNDCQKNMTIYLEEIYQNTNHYYFCLIYPKYKKSEISQLVQNYSIQLIDYEYSCLPKEAYKKVKQKQKLLVTQERKVKQQLSLYKQNFEDFCMAEEMIAAFIQREQAKKQFVSLDTFFIAQGWIPEDEKQALLTAFKQNSLMEEIYIHFEEPTASEINQDIPIKLKNNRIVAPFEMLTEMYSLPKYQEVDPTPLMTPFYLVFFGMMVADIGYGLLMFLGAILATHLFVLSRSMKRFADFLLILSFPTIVWGFIYSSFFGISLPTEIGGIHLPFPLLSTTEDINTILILSVIFGLIQIIVGLMLNGIELTKQKRYLDSINESFAWLGLLFGVIMVIISKSIMSSQLLFLIGLFLIVVSAISIVLVPTVQHPSKPKGFAKGLYGLYGMTGYIGDLVSYTRLMALGISGGSIAAAFNMLVSFMPPVARFSVGILLIIVLHILNLFLSLLGAYVHGARLQYVEFFGKFYTGGGRAFRPLKTEEKYVNIERKLINKMEEKNK